MVEAVRGNSSYGWTVQYALSYDDYYADASVRMMVQTMPIGIKWHQYAHFFWKDFTGASLKFIESKPNSLLKESASTQ